MSAASRGPMPRRTAVTLGVGVVMVVILIVVFAGTLARSTDLESRAAEARAEVAALEARVEAGRAEVDFLESDPFVDQYARSVGFGVKGETPFALPADAPPPPPVTPLGTALDGEGDAPPFEAWMELLFGG